jgi:serine/threonine protein kinase
MSRLDLGHLDPDEWERLQGMADRFEQACRGAGPVDLTEFLPPQGDPLRPVALQELIKTDLEIRWRHRQNVSLESYLARFPELGSAASLPAALIYEEYRARQLYGDRPPLDGYRGRFPAQFADLQKLARDQPVQVTPSPSVAPTRPDPTGPGPPPDQFALGREGYKTGELLGQGSFAEVFRGEAPGGIPVAIKRISKPIDRKEAQRELQSLELIKKLRHPFLLATHSFWMAGDRLYIVMELADGTLRDRLRQCHKEGLPGIPLDELVPYAGQASRALDFLHGRDVLHRDIKPENLLLLEGFVKVGDFGLARGVMEAQHSVTGAGTPRYMAPEAWRGHTSRASDQYSLALTYLDLRGHWPFAGQNMADMLMAHLYSAPDLGPLPKAEQKVLRRALAKEPEQRYPSCGAFAHELHEALADVVGRPAARPAPPPPKPAPPPAPPREDRPAVTPSGPTSLAADFRTLIPARSTPPTIPAPAAPGSSARPAALAPAPENEPAPADSQTRDAALEYQTVAPPAEPQPAPPPAAPLDNSSADWVPLPAPEAAEKPRSSGTGDREGAAALVEPSIAEGAVQVRGNEDATKTPVAELYEGRRKPPSLWRRLVTPALYCVLTLTLAALAWAGWQRWFSSPIALGLAELSKPIAAGEVRTIPIWVTRHDYGGPIRVTFPNLPQGVQIEEVTIPEHSDSAHVEMMVLPNAPEGAADIMVSAQAGERRPVQKAVQLPIGEPSYRLPEGWQPAASAQLKAIGKRCYYDRIEIHKAGIAVPFLLIPEGEREELWDGGDPIRTFYIMEDKVWVALFRQFVEEMGPLKDQQNRWADPAEYGWCPVLNQDPEHPVMGVILPDAQAFAKWLGGRIPLLKQWDKASGRFEKGRGEGPYGKSFSEMEGEIAIGRGKDDIRKIPDKGTMRRDDPIKKDVSPFGVRDMSGNGLEWTRPPEGSSDAQSVELRGRRWDSQKPLSFATLDNNIKDSQVAKDARDGTGFRVVIEL